MTAQSTQFNPFGEKKAEIEEIKAKIEKVAENFEKEAKEGGKIGLETRNVAQAFEKLAQIAKAIDGSAVRSLLSELSTPLGHFLNTLCTKSEKIVRTDVGFLNRCSAKLIGAISEKISGPFTSDDLEQWLGILEPLCVGKAMKETAVVLWKATFATVKGPLKYPGNSRETLKKMTTSRKVYFPADESSVLSRNPSFDDEEAMDGMSATTASESFVAPDSQSLEFSQVLSQQPEADNLAEKLLKEQKKQKEIQKTPTRRRASKLPTLVDEDSCDFVAITTTPTSSKKVKLTDRQKEKLAEAAGPRTTINYVDEESQSGFAKTEQLKAALSAMNYDVGEESVSAPAVGIKSSECVKSIEKVEEGEPMETDEKPEIETTTRTTRARKSLFEPDTKNTESKEIQKEIPMDSEVLLEDVKVEGGLEKMPKMTETVTPKRNGRAKKTPKQCLPERTPPTKKRLRSSAKKEDSDAEVIESKAPEPKMAKIDGEFEEKMETEDQKTPDDVVKESRHTPEVEDSVAKVAPAPEENEAPAPEENAPEVKKPEDSEFVEDVKDSDGSQELSPPKTPRTPSILRTRKEGVLTPLTERKKNRVHFPVELPDDEPRSNPTTPRRQKSMVLAIDVKSPVKPSESSVSSESSASSESLGLLEISDPFSSNAPFYKGLVGCKDPIERIVRKLAPMNLKTASDNVRRCLHAANIRTIGDFASLTKKQINEMSGIKNPKEKSSRSVLAEYESEKLKEVRRSEEKPAPEEHKQEVEVATDNTDKDDKMNVEHIKEPITSDNQEITDRPSSPPLQPLPMLISKDSDSESQGSESSVESLISDKNNDKGSSDKKVDEHIRKNLAPIFEKNRVVKNEIRSPQKPKSTIKESPEKQSTISDFRDLHNVVSRLSMAHILNSISPEVWTAHMDTITKSAILFRSIVQKHGIALGDDWNETEWEKSSEDVDTTPEADLKTLRMVSRRISRCEARDKVDVETWRHVMDTVSEAATFLENVVKQRGQKA